MKRIFIGCLTLCLILYTTLPTILSQVRHLLTITVTPPTSFVDAIVVLGGDHSGKRVSKAVELLSTYQSKFIVFTSGASYLTSEPALMLEFAQHSSKTLPTQILEEDSQSTYDHAVYLEPIFRNNHIKSILLVTSNFHSARSYQVFKHYYKEKSIPLDIYIIPSNDGITYSSWWKHHEMTQSVVIELLKKIYYSLFIY